jgi:hypothetical protein
MRPEPFQADSSNEIIDQSGHGGPEVLVQSTSTRAHGFCGVSLVKSSGRRGRLIGCHVGLTEPYVVS